MIDNKLDILLYPNIPLLFLNHILLFLFLLLSILGGEGLGFLLDSETAIHKVDGNVSVDDAADNIIVPEIFAKHID